MHGLARRGKRRSARKVRRPVRTLAVLRLESRLLLHGGAHHDEHEPHFDPAPGDALSQARPATQLSAAAVGRAAAASLAVPALDSLPGAAASLYLDFDGHFEPVWGSYRNVVTPAYDQDGDRSSFSVSEIQSIRGIWRRVAEDFAPFKLNVTTVDPGDFSNRKALRVSIGGDGRWIGPYGGVAYIDAFTNSIANTVYVFSDNLAGGLVKYVAEAASHEAGHGFGLWHQSTYDSRGRKLEEYNPGEGDWAPIMGLSYYATHTTWHNGKSSRSASTTQQDLSIIGSSNNGFRYRPDDHGNTRSSATPLDVIGSSASGSGIITTLKDEDYFSFSTGNGVVSFAVDAARPGPNLDIKLSLRTSGGVLLASDNPTTSLDASLTANLRAGSYRLVVASNGSYGSLGQYTISGTIVPTSRTADAAPLAEVESESSQAAPLPPLPEGLWSFEQVTPGTKGNRSGQVLVAGAAMSREFSGIVPADETAAPAAHRLAEPLLRDFSRAPSAERKAPSPERLLPAAGESGLDSRRRLHALALLRWLAQDGHDPGETPAVPQDLRAWLALEALSSGLD